MFKYALIYIIAKDETEAKKIGDVALKYKLAACANIIPGIQSLFTWNEKKCCENETIVILKTKVSLVKQLTTLIKSEHSYDTPCIIALPIIGGNEDFLQWIENETSC